MPTAAELTFALKTFAGAMAALFLALWLGLDNPYWSMATAYIVAQPLTGAMRSKALYRFIGTFTGGTAAVILVPPLVNAPVLLSLAMAAWIGLCLYLSLLDRTPRAYMFMLAGYTAGIIGLPSVGAPGHIFETALTRVEEISIGIVCTTVIGTLFFPRALGPVLAKRIAGWVRPAIDWAQAALAGRAEDADIWTARRRLAVEAADVAMLTSQLAYDTSHLAGAVAHVTRLRIYLLSLMPVLSSISTRVAALARLPGGITPELRAVLTATSDWVRAGGPENAAEISARIAALETPTDSWAGLLRASLALRLAELVSILRHARAIRRHVVDGDPAPSSVIIEDEHVAMSAQLRDHGLALLSAVAAAVATLLVCAFWIFTAWPAGAGAAVIVAVACSFFAAQDDPAPAIALMTRNAVIVTVAAGLYLFLVLPRVESFWELALVLLPAGLVIGVLVSRPATFGTGMVMGAFGATDLAISNGYAGDFAAYLNNAAALIFGLVAALVVTRLMRSVGAEWSARRLLRAGWADVAAAAQGVGERRILTGRMMDRLGLLMPRLAAVSPGADLAAADVLVDLRIGLNVLGLQRRLGTYPPAAQMAVRSVLAQIAAHYRGNPLIPPDVPMLAAIDEAIRRLTCDDECHHEGLMFLSGLRSVLFAAAAPPDASAWVQARAAA
jgi:uncharacterized membrane protein YccC